MTTKTIHYCWFGKNEKSTLIKKCIESWKKYCPNFDIVEWNEDNFDVRCCKYVEEAYNNKKWAFVSDYCRFWVLYNYGGVYVDTDVEFIKPIDDLPDNFVGFESKNYVASGLIRGAKKGDEFCKKMLESYQSDRFLIGDKTFNLETVCVRETRLLVKNGMIQNGKCQSVMGTKVYSAEYFNPKGTEGTLNISDNTYSIHHYEASWYSDVEKETVTLAGKIGKIMPQKLSKRLAHFIVLCRHNGFRYAVRQALLRIFRRKK